MAPNELFMRSKYMDEGVNISHHPNTHELMFVLWYRNKKPLSLRDKLGWCVLIMLGKPHPNAIAIGAGWIDAMIDYLNACKINDVAARS